MSRRRPLSYAAALRRMGEGAQLIQTNGKRAEFSLEPGGLIATRTAERILSHSLCEPADSGLPLPGARPQSWRFKAS